MLEKRKSVSFTSEVETDSDNQDVRCDSPVDVSEGGSGKESCEDEKRLRRQIANKNERRRMESINAGFTALKELIPRPDGDKLSKAAILQHTKEHLQTLTAENKQLASQNSRLKKILEDFVSRDKSEPMSPPLKRKKSATECSDEGISVVSPRDGMCSLVSARDELAKEVFDLRVRLEKEYQMRRVVEEHLSTIRTALTMPAETISSLQAKTERLILEKMSPGIGQNNLILDKITPPLGPTNYINTGSSPPVPTSHIPQLPSPKSVDQMDENVSQRNLNTIVEAIRVLEGNEVFGERLRSVDQPPDDPVKVEPQSHDDALVSPIHSKSVAKALGLSLPDLPVMSLSGSNNVTQIAPVPTVAPASTNNTPRETYNTVSLVHRPQFRSPHLPVTNS